MGIDSKSKAQKRADRIAAFKEELAELGVQGVVKLTESQEASIDSHHRQLLAEYSDTFDIDIGHRERQFSLGMKVASFLGALALALSVFFLFYRYWGLFPTVLQVGVLIAAPLLALVATWYVTEREKTGYFAGLLALLTFACFVLDISVLGVIYNITPSDRAFIAWGLLAFLLAYHCDSRLLLAAGIICLGGLLATRVSVFYGLYWLDFYMRPENFLPVAIVLFLASFYLPHRGHSGFQPIYRVFALLGFFIPVLILSYAGALSYALFDEDLIEMIYRIIGFAASAGLIALGIRLGLNDVVNTANAFFVLFLYTQLFDWWWHWMPKFLFFLLVGLIAVLLLFVLKRLRDLSRMDVSGGRP